MLGKPQNFTSFQSEFFLLKMPYWFYPGKFFQFPPNLLPGKHILKPFEYITISSYNSSISNFPTLKKKKHRQIEIKEEENKEKNRFWFLNGFSWVKEKDMIPFNNKFTRFHKVKLWVFNVFMWMLIMEFQGLFLVIYLFFFFFLILRNYIFVYVHLDSFIGAT